MQNSPHPLSTCFTTACQLLDFMMQGKITEANAPTIRLDATPSGLSDLYQYYPPFTPNALSAATLAFYPGLGQALNIAGLHTRWL